MNLFSSLDPGLAEEVERMSRYALPTNIFEGPPPILPMVSAPSPEGSFNPAPKKQRLSHNLVVLPSLEIELEEEVAASVGLIGEIEPDSRLELQRQIGYVAWHSSSNDIAEMKGPCEIRTGDDLFCQN